MRFEYPWLILLIIIPLAFLILRSKGTARATHSMVAILKEFESRWVTRLLRVLAALIVVGFAVAIARPMVEGGIQLVLTRTRDKCILIDKSGSMDSVYSDDADPKLTKYGLSRLLALKFMELRKDDRITVFVFNDKIYALWPLTSDHGVFREWLTMPDTAEMGTEIDVAMIACLEHLEELGQTGERTIILVSDGEDNWWSVDMEAQIENLLKKTNTKLFWIYVESPSGIKRNREENKWNASQKGLFRFVKMTGGKMFDAGSENALKGAYEAIAELQTHPAWVRLQMPETDLYPIVLGSTLAVSFAVYVFARIWIR